MLDVIFVKRFYIRERIEIMIRNSLVTYCEFCKQKLTNKKKNVHSKCEKDVLSFANNNYIRFFLDLFISECRDFRFDLDYWVFNSHKPRIYKYKDSNVFGTFEFIRLLDLAKKKA